MQHPIAGRRQSPLLLLAALGVSLAASCGRAQSIPESPAKAGEPATPVAAGPVEQPEPNRAAPAAQSPEKGDPKSAEKKPAPANRLAKETSPYLLLHAHNPVDWYPWGAEALAKAKAESKLIFLSVGYSSCYWCHVMERESFMDDEIADFLNKHFVCIKVDREERPDVDEIYMTALRVYYQVIGSARGGGWPLSMFLTPDGQPIAGGTYFPPRDRENMDGFLSVVGRVDGFWQKDPEAVKKTAEQLTDFVRQTLRRRAGLPTPLPGVEILADVQQALAEEYDARHGGFGFSEADPRKPKFPEPANLLFLLDRVRRSSEKKDSDKKDGDAAARAMLVGTLEKMAAGGIRDHLGGGFHRYSTDRYWRIPHFEKMLYDNAQLATVYAEAYALTGNPQFKQVVEELLAFVERELTSPDGAFYSALDAETEAEEGRFYVWEKAELQSVLGGDGFDVMAGYYALRGEPNFEGRYAIEQDQPGPQEAERRKLKDAELQAQLQPLRDKLLAVRDMRPRPLTDTKVLTSWNGLMIRGFANAGRILKNEHYLQVAVRAADFVLNNLRTPDGRLMRTYGNGQAKLNGYHDDYAFMTDGLIALHQATGEQRWLDAADSLTQAQIRWFWDDEAGGFYFTSSDHEQLLARSKDPVDSATPAAGSVSVSNLVYLARELKKADYLDRAEKTVQDSASLMARSPTAMPRMAVSLAALLEAKEK